jgi:hypothetical protein
MGSIIHTKGITSKNGLIFSEIGRGGQDFFTPYILKKNDFRILSGVDSAEVLAFVERVESFE